MTMIVNGVEGRIGMPGKTPELTCHYCGKLGISPCGFWRVSDNKLIAITCVDHTHQGQQFQKLALAVAERLREDE